MNNPYYIPGRISPKIDFKTEIERYYNLQPGTLKNHSRKRAIVMPRQIAMWFYYKQNIATKKQAYWQSIANEFGNYDHSTVIHAVKKINDALTIYKKFKSEINEIQSIIFGNVRFN